MKECVESHILLCSYIWPIPSMSTKDRQSQTVSQPTIQPDKVDRPMGSSPRPCLDFDHIGQNREDSRVLYGRVFAFVP